MDRVRTHCPSVKDLSGDPRDTSTVRSHPDTGGEGFYGVPCVWVGVGKGEGTGLRPVSVSGRGRGVLDQR